MAMMTVSIMISRSGKGQNGKIGKPKRGKFLRPCLPALVPTRGAGKAGVGRDVEEGARSSVCIMIDGLVILYFNTAIRVTAFLMIESLIYSTFTLSPMSGGLESTKVL